MNLLNNIHKIVSGLSNPNTEDRKRFSDIITSNTFGFLEVNTNCGKQYVLEVARQLALDNTKVCIVDLNPYSCFFQAKFSEINSSQKTLQNNLLQRQVNSSCSISNCLNNTDIDCLKIATFGYTTTFKDTESINLESLQKTIADIKQHFEIVLLLIPNLPFFEGTHAGYKACRSVSAMVEFSGESIIDLSRTARFFESVGAPTLTNIIMFNVPTQASLASQLTKSTGLEVLDEVPSISAYDKYKLSYPYILDSAMNGAEFRAYAKSIGIVKTFIIDSLGGVNHA